MKSNNAKATFISYSKLSNLIDNIWKQSSSKQSIYQSIIYA